MKKYEYQTVSQNLTTTELCEYGDQGWRLVNVVPIDDWYNVRHYFIREIEQIHKEWWPNADGYSWP